MSKSNEGEKFLLAFNEMRDAVGDDPDTLAATWKDNPQLQQLCDEIAHLVALFRVAEEWSPYAFTINVAPAGAHARRDFEDRWRSVVHEVASRELLFLFEGLGAGDIEDIDDYGGGMPDRLAMDIADWKDDAGDDAGHIEQLIDFAVSHLEVDDSGELDWVHSSARAWDLLKVAGLDLKGTLWRRRALPHILVPSHVAGHYGTARASLYRRLHQAGRAFTFGAPLAALALQRAVMEEVLSRHWDAERGHIREANLPELSWDARADRLKNLANDALHNDPEKMSPDQLDRAIIENFMLLRLLIERAPNDGVGRKGEKK